MKGWIQTITDAVDDKNKPVLLGSCAMTIKFVNRLIPTLRFIESHR